MRVFGEGVFGALGEPDSLGGTGLVLLDFAAERLDSTLTATEYRATMDAIRGGRLRLLYVAPERFNNERFREGLDRVDLPLFAVDEAQASKILEHKTTGERAPSLWKRITQATVSRGEVGRT